MLAAFGLHQILSVRKLGKVHAHGILGVITFVKIDHFPGLEGFLSLAQRKVGVVEIAENHLRAALFHPHVQILAFQLLQKVLHPRAGLGQGGLLARKVLPDPFKALAGLGQGLVLLAAGLPQIQFFLVHQQPVGLREKGQCLAGILASEGLEGLPFEGKFLPGEGLPAQHPVFQRAVGWISAIQLFLKDLVDFFLLGAGVTASLQEVPQHEFPVGADKGLQGPVQKALHTPVEGRVVAFEALGMLLHKGPELLLGSSFPLLHPKEGNQRMIQALHIGLQVLPKLVPLLPVPSEDGVHVLRGGVVEVYRKVLAKGLGLDLGKDFRLLLGAVFPAGVFVAAPKICQHVSVFHGKGIKKAGENQRSGYH